MPPRKPKPPRPTLGQSLREARHAAGLTQVQLAERAGVAQSAISDWERGAESISRESVTRLCEALGCDAGYDGQGWFFGRLDRLPWPEGE
jgi:transcriptional regulator with XRE-family HTH domain